MTRTIKAICVILGIICTLSSIPRQGRGNALAKEQEIKGVWVATLYSMDFPSTPSVDAKALKKMAASLLENVEKLGFNTIFFQARPAGDALYPSQIYPWSRYLTGTEGKAPSDGFDPLEYIVSEAHKKGILVHAWINPYRITASEKDSESLSDASIAKKHPHLVVKHTDGKLYLNPGEPESRKIVIDGALEIVRGYEIDGIHIDDYFYPSSAFPDSDTFTKYGGKFSDIGDWRRDNTTRLVKELGEAIKKEDPDVLFSVSPCGIWANKSSNVHGSDTSGKQAYYDYYADTRLWVKEELVDIIIPQVYWNIGYPTADFEVVSNWWNETVEGTDVALCIGQGVYKAAEETEPASPWYGQNGFNELEKQLSLISSLDNTSGFVQYRLGSILSSEALSGFVSSALQSTPLLFTDINDHPWAKDSIEALYKKGVISGMGDGTFGGFRQVTRADFALMLVRLSKQNVPFVENFSDVTEDKYYYKEVGVAKVLGFVTGRDGNIFDPSGFITREDMATMVWRVLVKEGRIKGESNFSLASKFSDAEQISEYARLAVSAMAEKKIINGYETGEFKPKGFATRAECACILNRVSELLY